MKILESEQGIGNPCLCASVRVCVYAPSSVAMFAQAGVVGTTSTRVLNESTRNQYRALRALREGNQHEIVLEHLAFVSVQIK